MINTDKYEGHTLAEHWDFSIWGITMPTGFDADAQLIADAPLLLAKVKRLDEMLSLAHEWVASNLGDDVELEAFLAYIDIGEE